MVMTSKTFLVAVTMRQKSELPWLLVPGDIQQATVLSEPSLLQVILSQVLEGVLGLDT
jgi:hypothetical protein